jgi:hypothetical protein
MVSKSLSFWVLALVVLMAASAGGIQSTHKQRRASLLDFPVDQNTAVRFFYNPPGDYFHVPLVFRVVGQGDARLNTAPLGDEGRTAYISRVEMQKLIQGLPHSDLSWQESENVEILGSYKRLLTVKGSMEILVVCSKGTARTKVPPNSICKTLKPLDAALKTPRALWEFQGFRLNYGCKVPGFNYDAYPDRQ